jgi:Nucleoside-diphosphate-sugar epimerases
MKTKIIKRAIVTGANGFLGSSLINKLISKDYYVYAIVRNNNSDNIIKHFNMEIINCEMSSINNLTKLIQNDVDIFYHFAWTGSSGDERSNYQLQLQNIEYTCDCVKVAKQLNCKRFIFAGSIMEYESMSYLKDDFSHPGLGYIYSTAKLTADFMAKTLSHNLQLDYITLTISNIYGKGEKSKRFIYTTIKKLITKQKMAFTAGEQLYDFIYISDAVEAIYLVGEYGKTNSSYYIGNKEPRQLKDFIVELKNCIDHKIKLDFGEVPFNGPFLSYTEFDTGKLEREFDFRPKVSFSEGIHLTLDYLNIEDDF